VFYSSGLSLQSMGLKVKRWVATMLDVLISTALVAFIVFVADFTAALNDFVALLVVWVGPYGAIWMCDGYQRGWAANKLPQSGSRRALAGWIALAAGMLIGALTMRSPLYDGPIATALGGTDLNWVLGFLVSGGMYYALTVTPARRAKLAALAPDPST
jgi:purine-cytosine permease-like protein